MPSEIASEAAEPLEHYHCALAFQVSDDGGNRIFRRYRQAYVDVIRTGCALDYFHLLILTELPQYVANIATQFAINDLSPILRYKNYVVFTFPCRVC